MITEDYCSFEVAKLLKEKGFDELCKYLYMNNGERYTLASTSYQNVCDDGECLCPTHQMAMAWLREHKIYIMIDRSWSMEDSWQYCICVNNDFDHLIQQDSIPNRTYEEAVEAALKYTLENLI